MLNKLENFYKKEQYNPRLIGLFINPFYFARKGLYSNISDLILNLDGKLLDIGCGSKPYKDLYHVDEYIGLEIDDEGNRQHMYADIFYDGVNIPCEDKEFDSLISNQVFEHVFNPTIFLQEINRVAKMDAKLLLTVPFVWDEHEQPYDYARYSSFGLEHILSQYGFQIIEQRKSNNGVEVIFQLINNYLYKITLTKSRAINLFSMFFLMAPINIIGLFFGSILPKNNDLYLDNIILAKKIKDV